MLTQADNELLVRTGPKTPMGDLFRRFWHPVLLSAELPEPDGAPVRVTVLGEDLRAFRTTYLGGSRRVGTSEQRHGYHDQQRGSALRRRRGG